MLRSLGEVKPINLTVYRVTPKNYTGTITDLNTADAGGDGFFATYEMTFPLYCTIEPEDDSCKARPQLNVPNNNVFEQSTVEVDPRFGIYSGCIPNTTTHTSTCEAYTNLTQCWWDQLGPGNVNHTKMFESLCSRSQCQCPALTNYSVGAYFEPMAQWPIFWHKQTPIWIQLENISKIWSGTWYSTLSGGECKENQKIGDGSCFWRWHGVKSRVNATCVKSHIADAAIKNNKPCFETLPNPANVSAIGWSACLMTGITGINYENVTAHGSPLSTESLINTFKSAFLPESQGGCPVVVS